MLYLSFGVNVHLASGCNIKVRMWSQDAHGSIARIDTTHINTRCVCRHKDRYVTLPPTPTTPLKHVIYMQDPRQTHTKHSHAYDINTTHTCIQAKRRHSHNTYVHLDTANTHTKHIDTHKSHDIHMHIHTYHTHTRASAIFVLLSMMSPCPENSVIPRASPPRSWPHIQSLCTLINCCNDYRLQRSRPDTGDWAREKGWKDA